MSENNPSFSLVNLTMRLGVIAAIAAIILTLVNLYTLQPREDARAKVILETLNTVLPPHDCVGKKFEFQGTSFYGAFSKDKHLIALAAEGKAEGYGGEMIVMFGLSLDGTIGIVDVVAQNETPGLGTIESQRTREKTIFNLTEKTPSGIAPNRYLDQFYGKISPTPYQQGDLTGIVYKTGATVTMYGITNAVYGTAALYNANSDSIKMLARESIQEVK